jgi:transcription termination/antitermination protein NusG
LLFVNGADRHAHEWQQQALPRPIAHEAWYAVWLRSHYEQVVTQQLAAKGFQTFLPQVRSWSRRSGTTRTIRTPMFPGYLFVRDALDKGRYIDLLKVSGVVRVLEDGWSRLTPVPDVEIDAIQQIASADVMVFPYAHLRRGQHVRVLDGPLAGLEGIFVQDKASKGRLVVSVNMLGRSIAVEMDGADVEACQAAPARGAACEPSC